MYGKFKFFLFIAFAYLTFSVGACPETLVDVLITLMVHPSYVNKVNFEQKRSPENCYQNLERKILESCQKILPQNCKPNESSKNDMKQKRKIILCDILKTNVKDVLIQQCGIVLGDLAKNDQNLDKFVNVLNHCNLILMFLTKPKQLGIEVKDKRLENVSSNLFGKCASVLTKNMQREAGKSLFAASKNISAYLDSWNSFLESTKKCVLLQNNAVEGISKVNTTLFDLTEKFVARNSSKNNVIGNGNGGAKASQNDGFSSSDDDMNNDDLEMMEIPGIVVLIVHFYI